jgi:flavin reductase (DIM6/NTAB) family NADH-FMN oxidoreductase RutF
VSGKTIEKERLGIRSSVMRRVAGYFATGVAVVTTRDESGRVYGLTMNAVSSLSLDPSLFLICVDRTSKSLCALLESEVFAINFLAREQEELSRVFASKVEDKFAGVGYHTSLTGAPLLDGALAAVECSVIDTYPGGDHVIVSGQVENVEITGGEPLLFYQGGYAGLSRDRRTS